MTLAAQNGITISDFSTKAGSPTTVTFNVQWVPLQGKVWSDTAWVFVDYNNAGTMTRLPLSGATLTAHSAPGVGKVVEEGDNDKGVWVVGNARDEGSFSATVQLRVETWHATSLHGLCVYAINYPPVGQYTAVDKIKFTGTPPFYLTYSEGGAATVSRAEAKEDCTLENTLASFTDASRAPGIIKCKTPATLTLQSSATVYCADAAGVTLSLSGTDAGADYRLIKEGSESATTFTGSGSAATFTGTFGAGTYHVETAPGAFCAATLTSRVTVTEVALPNQPTITASAATVCQNAALVFGVQYPITSNATYTWTSTDGTQSSSNSSYTFNTANAGAKTATVYVQVNNGGTVCRSTTTAATSAWVQALPNQPTITASAATVCQNAALVFGVQYPITSNATYTWTGTDGTQSSSNSSYTFNTADAGAKTATVNVLVNDGGTVCRSTTSDKNTAQVYELPTVSATEPADQSACTGVTVTLTIQAQANVTYSWYNKATGTSLGTGASYATSTSGSYYAVATSDKSCTITSRTATVTLSGAGGALGNTPTTCGCAAGLATAPGCSYCMPSIPAATVTVNGLNGVTSALTTNFSAVCSCPSGWRTPTRAEYKYLYNNYASNIGVNSSDNYLTSERYYEGISGGTCCVTCTSYLTWRVNTSSCCACGCSRSSDGSGWDSYCNNASTWPMKCVK